MRARQKSGNHLKRGVAQAIRGEMKNTSTADHRPAAGDNDGGIMQETFNQVLPNELLRGVVKSWCAYETGVLSRKQKCTNLPDIGLSNT